MYMVMAATTLDGKSSNRARCFELNATNIATKAEAEAEAVRRNKVERAAGHSNVEWYASGNGRIGEATTRPVGNRNARTGLINPTARHGSTPPRAGFFFASRQPLDFIPSGPNVDHTIQGVFTLNCFRLYG